MSRLTIQVDEADLVRIYVGDRPIGLIEDISFSTVKDNAPVVIVSMVDVDSIEDVPREAYVDLKKRVREYKLLLAQIPCVQVLDKGDTLPSSKVITQPPVG